MALDIKKIIKQETAKVMLEQHLLEAETPDHFGGGENIEIYGYKTENFDICKSAVILFNKIKEENLEGMAVDHAKKSAEHLDKVFGIEKDVVEEGSASPEQIEEAIDNNMLFGYELGSLAMHTNNDYTRDTGFAKMHVMEIANRFDGSMTEYGANTTYGTSFAHGSAEEEVSESKINEAPMDKRFAKEFESSVKAFTNHIKHELSSAQGSDKSVLKKMLQNLMTVSGYPKLMTRIVGEGKINEISTKAGLEDVIKGRTSAIEGIKMSKDLAQGMMDFINRSPYGRKYGKQIMKGRIASLIRPANAFGIERYLSPKAKKEFKDIYKKHAPKREVKEAAPGYMHDCASKVIHKEHGAGTCIPEQHNLVKEGKKWVVTEYDVKFDSGKIVRNVPVNELKIVSESHHGHKRRKKKKTNEMKVTNHKGENITKYVLQLLQGKINKKQFEKLTGLKKDKMKELAEKLVFYRDEQKRLRRFDTNKAANRRLSR